MSDLRHNLTDLLTRGLACAASSQALRSILVFDIHPSVLRLAAAVFAQLLEVVTGHQVDQISLGPSEIDDDLWGSLSLSSEIGGLQVVRESGLLTRSLEDSSPRVVVIPDVTQLGLAAARACVTLMGADVAHLERHGQSELWVPNLFWLAGCASHNVGRVSPHFICSTD